MIRLGIMVFLLLLTFSEFFNLTDRGMRFEYYRDVQYIAFFVTGFCLGILYLVLTFRFLGSIVLFRVQILADLFLITWWVILTGGSFSGFSFLYMLALFFYGRMLGMRTIFLSSILVWITIFLISCVQFYFP
ncbi:MAG: hypothetical protein GXY42_00550, partial [Desulfovibrionales bacterium]|nr:hypothetical protein [Desulfovibrionales bacterium]